MSKKNSPLISIITCTHGRRMKQLKRAVDSVMVQTYQNWELHIVDDASEDDTPQYARGLTDTRIHYHRRQTNWGNQTKPINEVLPHTKGTYIAFLDSDNEYLPDHLQALVGQVVEGDYDLVYGDRWFIDETGTIPKQIGVFSEYAPNLLLERNYIDMSDFIVKREAIFYVGGMDERYKRFADWNLLVRLSKANFTFKRVPLAITNYHFHDKSLSRELIENVKEPSKPLWNAYELEIRLPYLGEIPKPRVVVYSLVKDRLRYTKTCFRKLKKLSGYEYDHVVVDQGSTDGTREWIRESYKPTVYIQNSENLGIAVGSNQALDAIGDAYDIIIKIDNDCYPLTSGWLEQFVELYKRTHRMAFSPYPEGLLDNPGGSPRYAYGNLNGHLLGLVQHLGGLCMVCPAEFYADFRWDETTPKHFIYDLLFSQYLTRQGYGLAYVEDIRVSHGPKGTLGQYKDYPEYFQKRKEELAPVGDPNSKEHWDTVYKTEGNDDPNRRNDEFSFKIIQDNMTRGTLLDVGCGTGYLIQYLGGGDNLYGVDLSEAGVDKAQERNPRSHFKVGNVYKLPYKDNEFDQVVSTEVLEHLQDISSGVTQMHRVLKKGGTCLNLLPYKDTIPSHEHVAQWDEQSIKEVFSLFSQVDVTVYEHPEMVQVQDGKVVGPCKMLFVKAVK